MPHIDVPPPRRPLLIGSLAVDPPLLMAPMAGFTTFAFRQVVRRFGGCGLLVTEMFSARGFRQMEARGRKLPERLWGVVDEARPLAVQTWDNDPAALAEVGRRLVHDFRADVVDLNFGCPAPDVAEKAESGAYLLGDPARVGHIVAQVVAACAGTPVTAKIRLGVSREAVNAAEVAQAIEEAGGAAVTIHGRTAADFYRGRADWEAIARVRPYLRRMPLIGNGDIATATEAVAALQTYPVDGVMIGRAAVRRPWIFQQAAALLSGKPVASEPDAAALRSVLLQQFDDTAAQFGPARAAVLMRKAAACYAHGRPGARAFRVALAELDSAEAFRAIVERHFSA